MNGGGRLKVNIFIDLCSGLGGASEAFIDDDDWEVYRFDNSQLVRDVPNTVIVDLAKSPEDVFQHVVTHSENIFGRIVIWASPPCEQWSQGYSSQINKDKRNGKVFVPNLQVLHGIMKIIDEIAPDYWYVENVVGGQPFIDPLLGPARLKHRPWILWGNFPRFDIRLPHNHKSKRDKWSSRDPMRYHKRSLIPIEISRSIKSSITGQKTMDDFQ